MSKTRHIPPGLLVKDLKPDTLYRCRLNGAYVLVQKEGDRLRGWWYNPTFGAYQYLDLKDRQLQTINNPWPPL